MITIKSKTEYLIYLKYHFNKLKLPITLKQVSLHSVIEDMFSFYNVNMCDKAFDILHNLITEYEESIDIL